MKHTQLKRILGLPTALLLAMGVAVGSGIFRTPGMVAGELGGFWLIVLAWTCGGVVVLMQGMVTAELATRFPQAGGEYVFLRETYGRFVAFFFGWAYTVFIVGGGAASIAAALGDFACDLFGVNQKLSGLCGAVALAAVVAVNTIGLRAGAGLQNVLNAAKIVALLAIAAAGLFFGTRTWGAVAQTVPDAAAAPKGWLVMLSAGFVPVLWCYEGTTDPAKMAEEIKDVRRALPRALIGSAAALTVVYVLVNVAFMRIMTPAEMASAASVPGEAMARLMGPVGRSAVLVVAILVCLGAISATILSTVRVTFALGRDGLAFAAWGRMSAGQAPVPALLAVGAFAIVLVWLRSFEKVLQIYFFAAALLFGLTYASLIIQRARGGPAPEGVYRCPAGVLQAVLLIILQIGIAVSIAVANPADAGYTTIMLALMAVFYVAWKRVTDSRGRTGSQ